MDFFSPQEFIWSKKQQKSLVLFLFPIINDWHNTIFFFNINFSKEWKINKIPSFSYHASRNFLLGVMWGCSWWRHYHRPLSFLSWDQILDSSISQIIQTKFDFRKKNWVSEGKKKRKEICASFVCMNLYDFFFFCWGGGLVLFSIIVNNLNWIFFLVILFFIIIFWRQYFRRN